MNPDIRKTVPPAGAITRVDAANAVGAANTAKAPNGPTHTPPSRPLVWAEVLFWLLPVAAFFLFPGYRTLGGQILIAGLFAMSLDLILGYARIVSLGHAAFFGLGAYTAGLLARHGWGEPISGLVAAAAVAAVAGLITSALIVRDAGHRPDALRGRQPPA
jgi:branched-chain amino acid transport system permease protein